MALVCSEINTGKLFERSLSKSLVVSILLQNQDKQELVESPGISNVFSLGLGLQ